jgi:CheY-like chemotaxis protein
MQYIVVASNSEILRLLGARGCERLGFSRRVVGSGPEALEATRQLKPRLAILDADMPALDGYSVCRRIKDDPDLKSCRVILAVSGILARATIDRLAEAGCDDVLVLPALGPEFFSHLTDMLGVPRRRSRRVAVELMARLDAGLRMWEGHVENLSRHGAKVQLYEPVGPQETVRVRLARESGGRGAVAEARVVWRQAGGRVLGLEFCTVTPEARRQLDSLMLWDVAHEEGVTRVYLEGEFVENTDFARLGKLLEGRVDFDAARVQYVNSQGSRLWCDFLASLAAVTELTFSRCSIAFTTQASMVPAFIGKGRIVSFHAPYRCGRCNVDDMRLVQTSAMVVEGGERLMPRFRCAQCNGYLVFDEVPERYFAFVDK